MIAGMEETGSMQAVVMDGSGGPEVLSLQSVPMPIPAAGEVRVRVATSGVNRADLLQRVGRYPVPKGWPEDILGLEFSGVVDALGPSVERWREGDRVMGILGGGGYAQYVTTHGTSVVPVPDSLDLDEAGAIPEVFMTALDAAVMQMGLRSGETLLIHAVGSGVGTAAVQIAKAFGARTLGTSRTPAKLERAVALGLDHAVPGDDAWPERVLELTEGRGVDVILDLVGGPYLEGNQKVVAIRGRHVVVGVPGGAVATIDLRAMMGRRATIKGTVLRARPVEEKAELAEAFEERVLPLFSGGQARPVIDRIFSPAEAAEAHRVMEANANFGKLLIRWE
jgi:putative PIG3 family NAD(P)H quinone oxidoreductase